MSCLWNAIFGSTASFDDDDATPNPTRSDAIVTANQTATSNPTSNAIATAPAIEYIMLAIMVKT
jgi:hypothetical protein